MTKLWLLHRSCRLKTANMFPVTNHMTVRNHFKSNTIKHNIHKWRHKQNQMVSKQIQRGGTHHTTYVSVKVSCSYINTSYMKIHHAYLISWEMCKFYYHSQIIWGHALHHQMVDHQLTFQDCLKMSALTLHRIKLLISSSSLQPNKWDMLTDF